MRKKTTHLNVYLGSTKEPWEQYCASLGKKPGAALREAIEQQLAKAETSSIVNTYRQTGTDKERKERFEILLTTSEKAAIKERAITERCSMRRWIVDAVRVGLTHEPQFSMSEIDALGESNYQLLALGRNLNQIARQLNESHCEPITVERIEALSRLIKIHTSIVSDAIRASLERWSITRQD
ncbi:plasmid mobilization relaxosome protein MobC [uncultured Pseudomonas sp.]|uniref:plasmid mobilization relaxosome protein MobC n=1 Tax=uncultured Pseudomonas sp. TaxID=114707 RepID=UPI002584E19D|nr:plasmid mobilization relaxosome protein MobC [uncultured Pseudomonas sp.]